MMTDLLKEKLKNMARSHLPVMQIVHTNYPCKEIQTIIDNWNIVLNAASSDIEISKAYLQIQNGLSGFMNNSKESNESIDGIAYLLEQIKL